MEHELKEITTPNGHNRKQRVLHKIEVPSLGLVFHRPDVNDFDILVYRRDQCVDTRVLSNTTPKAFRKAVRNYMQEHYPNETR